MQKMKVSGRFPCSDGKVHVHEKKEVVSSVLYHGPGVVPIGDSALGTWT